MRRSRSTDILYSILASGVALAFLGHGILGATVSDGTATTWVNVIGWLDIALAVVFAGLVIAAITRKAIAYSPLAIGLFAWAATWGFLTALSRFTAVLDGAETWDVVERGPNYLLPAGLVYLLFRIRKDERAERSEIIAARPAANGRSEATERVLAKH